MHFAMKIMHGKPSADKVIVPLSSMCIIQNIIILQCIYYADYKHDNVCLLLPQGSYTNNGSKFL